jgi:hypothetical protein
MIAGIAHYSLEMTKSTLTVFIIFWKTPLVKITAGGDLTGKGMG